jgi:uncharacterized repeat protein (TIGR01451 family)
MRPTNMILSLAAVLASLAAWAAGVVPGQQGPAETPPVPAAQVAAAVPTPPPVQPTPTPPPVTEPASITPPVTSPQVAVVDRPATTLPPATPTPMVIPSPMSAEAPPAATQLSPPSSLPPATVTTTPEAVSPVKDLPVDTNTGPTNDNPTGRQEPGVSLEWIGPSTAKLGQSVICQIIVKNISTSRVRQVTVRARIPEGVTVNATEPKAVTEDHHLVWNLGTFEVRQEKRLDLQLVPETNGSIVFPAFVTLTGCSTTRLEVREPKLELKASGPQQVIVGDPATVTLTVTNPGDASAERVKVRAMLSEGLEHARGKTIEFDLDTLAPHESRTVLVLCGALTPGTQRCDAVATADPKLSAQDGAAIEVVCPKLDVVVAGPGLRYLERHAMFLFRVSNTGTAVAHHVTLTDFVPAGFKVEAAPGAQHDFVARTVQWFLGDLQPNQSREVNLDLLAVNPGEHKNRVMVTAARGLRTDGEIVTRIEGLPALLMELADLDDPVEVGAKTSYEIRVTNTGTKTETNLQLVCTVPEQMECLDARGPAGCPFKVEGKQVIFQPLPKLAPRVDAIYRVSVRCLTPGDCRFRAQINADGLTNPVLREESTRVYGDEEPANPPRK